MGSLLLGFLMTQNKSPNTETLIEQIELLKQELSASKLANQALEQQLIETNVSMMDVFNSLESKDDEIKAMTHREREILDSFDTTFNSMDSILILVDNQGFIEKVNSTVLAELSYDADDLLGKNLDTLFQKQLLQDLTAGSFHYESALFSKLVNEQSFSGKFDLNTAHGGKRPYVAKGALQYDKFGKLRGGVISAICITELQQTETALDRSRMILEMMLETANDAIVVINDNDDIVLWNKQAELLFGYSREEAIKLKLHDLIVSPADKAKFERGLPYFKKTGMGPAINSTREVTAYRKDKSTFDSEVSVSSSKIAGHWHAFGVVRDVTERNEAKRALIAAKVEADNANLAKSQFLSTMSHEIRTPLNGIIGMMHLFKQTELSLQQSDYLEKTTISAKTLLTIINDILDFSKVEAGKMELEIAPFSLQSIKESVISSLQVKAQQKGLAFQFDIKPEVPLDLLGDAVRLNQIILNLASNAIKFTETGSVDIEVSLAKQVALKPNGVVLTFKVKDTGIGIADETIPFLFESFRQADSSTTRKFGGTGLGLAISQKLANLMKGQIHVESELDAGSTFSFTIELLENSQFVTNCQYVEPFKQALTFLVVDDNEMSLQVIEESLKSLNAHVVSFQNAAKAEEWLVKHQPDVILVDWKMPNLDGISLLKHFQAHRQSSDAVSILMSAYNTSEQISCLSELELDGVLKKPIDMKKLRHMVVSARSGKSQADMGGEMISLENKDVLLVEDNDINAHIAKFMLHALGMRVTLARDGQQAVNEVKEHGTLFDVILMDIQMPVMDGIEATKVIRDQLNVATPIIALTANVLPDEIKSYLELGMDAHVAKPLDTHKLEMAIRELLQT